MLKCGSRIISDILTKAVSQKHRLREAQHICNYRVSQYNVFTV